ncbi:MAG: hypothetical protein NT038_10805 [Euryarchaeota archaeon]|nr:hypothetical protein [Euryarchaeota archaeon]
MKKGLIVAGSIGAGVLLILALFPTVVCAQTVKSNEAQTNIIQQLKEKIKNTDWKPGDILNIKLLKDAMKDSGWFPGFYLFIFMYSVITFFIEFLQIFVF